MKNSLKRTLCSYFLITTLAYISYGHEPNPNLTLWYDKPATEWEEYLPLGNGKTGLMPSGGVYHENITLNDITLWSGEPQDANNYDAKNYLKDIRELLKSGKNELAQKMVDKHFVSKGPGSAGRKWGNFQTMGSLNINYLHDTEESFSHYKRVLNIETASATTEYKIGSTTYTREYFTSFNQDAGFIRIQSDGNKKVSLEVSLNREERASYKIEGDQLIMRGQLDNGSDGKGMKFITRTKVKNKGGTIEYKKNKIVAHNADVVLIYIVTDTDFRNNPFLESSLKNILGAEQSTWNKELASHTKNYQKYFNRLSFSLGNTQAQNNSTDKRLMNFKERPEKDPGLAALFFQYARYLSISSTRIGLLPPNLQGLWAHQIHTPWNGDYHLDVNVEMNHWYLGAANLSELELPLLDLVQGLVENGRKTAKAYYDAPGWVAHVITNVWGYTEPGESASWGIANSGSGWLSNNLWMHYSYTKDRDYLKKIYPILKGAAEFYLSSLTHYPEKDWLVTSPSVSPENAFKLPNGKHANVCMGPTIDNQIVRELFTNLISANNILGLKDPFCDTLKAKLPLLPPAAQIGKDGRIMEWLEEYEEVDPQHRHISHLYGVYPGNLISTDKTPSLARAAKRTLEVRGDDGPSWAIAYKAIFWAKLKEGERAYKLFKQLLTLRTDTNINYGSGGGVYPNLFTAGPPFQIDGNFGGAAAIAEMLVQNNENNIELLPSIPEDWKKEGEIRGIRAKGNITINMKWEEGKITELDCYSPTEKKVKVIYNGREHHVKTKKL